MAPFYCATLYNIPVILSISASVYFVYVDGRSQRTVITASAVVKSPSVSCGGEVRLRTVRTIYTLRTMCSEITEETAAIISRRRRTFPARPGIAQFTADYALLGIFRDEIKSQGRLYFVIEIRRGSLRPETPFRGTGFKTCNPRADCL